MGELYAREGGGGVVVVVVVVVFRTRQPHPRRTGEASHPAVFTHRVVGPWPLRSYRCPRPGPSSPGP